MALVDPTFLTLSELVMLGSEQLMCPLLQDFFDFQGVAHLVVWLLQDELCLLLLRGVFGRTERDGVLLDDASQSTHLPGGQWGLGTCPTSTGG